MLGRTGWRLALAAMLLAGAGCTSGAGHPTAGSAAPSPTPSPRYQSYVALGDSYTAGPFIPTTDLAGGCFRSDHDYPALLARRLHIHRLTDVSCSAAKTTALSRPQHTFRGAHVPAQLRAVSDGTDLVTLGIGGNDFNLFGTLVQTCTYLRRSDPSGAPCTSWLQQHRPDLFHDIRLTGVRVAHALQAIRDRAPHARLVLVGYLRLAPAHGTCAGLPLAAGDYPLARRVGVALDVALRRAARRGGATYVDMDAASSGHDVCAAHPWVNGRRTIRGRAFAYHPLEAGMRAVTRRVTATLSQGQP